MRSSARPRARRTWEPFPPASAHAAPDEIAIRPPRERISVSASARGMETWRLPGSRGERAPLTSTPSIRDRRPSSSRSRSAPIRSASPFRSAATAAREAAPRPTIPGTFKVPERRPFSCPPPSICGCRRRRGLRDLPHVERAHALGAVHLVGGEAHQVDAPGVDVHRHAAGGLDGVAVEEDAALAAETADLGDGLERAHLVVGRHHGDEDRLRPQRGRDRVHRDDPARGHRHARHRRTRRARGCGTAPGPRRARSPSPPGARGRRRGRPRGWRGCWTRWRRR